MLNTASSIYVLVAAAYPWRDVGSTSALDFSLYGKVTRELVVLLVVLLPLILIASSFQ